MAQIKTIQDVVDWGLCTGCGACYYACTENAVSLVNIQSVGIRPSFDSAVCSSCTKCLPICPGYNVDADLLGDSGPKTELEHEFGAALEIWEGYAKDPEIRYQASSGGLLSAIALFCLECENMASVLHVGADESQPWLNKTVQSTNRKDLLNRTGSRYAPASPCDNLGLIEASDRPCVFIGKPCDTAAVGALRRERPRLDRNLGLVLTFFCAGTPSTQGTLDLVSELQVKPSEITSLRYRGEGWPGAFKIVYDDQNGVTNSALLSYEESWSRLTKSRPRRCNLCPDGLGRVADIACGDAWESYEGKDMGRSIVLVRTRRGQKILRKAMESNYVHLEPITGADVLRAQPNLLQRRKELFGRLAGMTLLGIPIPRYKNFSLFRSWIRLPIFMKLRTLTGTVWRALQRGWCRRQMLFRLGQTSK